MNNAEKHEVNNADPPPPGLQISEEHLKAPAKARRERFLAATRAASTVDSRSEPVNGDVAEHALNQAADGTVDGRRVDGTTPVGEFVPPHPQTVTSVHARVCLVSCVARVFWWGICFTQALGGGGRP